MKIISFSAIKGGVGKTTICYNWGEYLAHKKNKKVLFIDMDNQCSLTQTFDCYEIDKNIIDNNIGNIFTDEDVGPVQIDKNVSIIAGCPSLDKLEASVETKTNKNMLLYMWMSKNADIIDSFDYILIDCHPDLGTATKNAIIVSHAIISPLIPSQYSYDSRENIEVRLNSLHDEAIDYQTGESYVTAKLFFVLNMLKNNTNATHQLLKNSQNDTDIIAHIPQRELFNKSTFISNNGKATPLTEMEKDHIILSKNRKFFEEINHTFDKMENTIDNV